MLVSFKGRILSQEHLTPRKRMLYAHCLQLSSDCKQSEFLKNFWKHGKFRLSTLSLGYLDISGGRFSCLFWFGILGEGSIKLFIAIIYPCVYIYILMGLITALTFSLLFMYIKFHPFLKAHLRLFLLVLPQKAFLHNQSLQKPPAPSLPPSSLFLLILPVNLNISPSSGIFLKI